MREILFRAKHIHALPQNEHLDGTWVYGYLCDENYINSPELEGEFLIDTETVCQYTGLTDKNGRKIFEGDVLSFTQKRQNANGIVKMVDGCFFAIIEGQKCWLSEGVKRYKGKVIDNVFDNPELIGE